FSGPGNGGMDAGMLLGCLHHSRQRAPVSDHHRSFTGRASRRNRPGTGSNGSQTSYGGSFMSIETNPKVTANQLKRDAFLYIRQSTPRQVLEHTESTARQYGYGSEPLPWAGR